VGGGNLEPEGWEFEFQVERRGGFCLEAATSVGFAASMEEVAASVLGGWDFGMVVVLPSKCCSS